MKNIWNFLVDENTTEEEIDKIIDHFKEILFLDNDIIIFYSNNLEVLKFFSNKKTNSIKFEVKEGLIEESKDNIYWLNSNTFDPEYIKTIQENEITPKIPPQKKGLVLIYFIMKLSYIYMNNFEYFFSFLFYPTIVPIVMLWISSFIRNNKKFTHNQNTKIAKIRKCEYGYIYWIISSIFSIQEKYCIKMNGNVHNVPKKEYSLIFGLIFYMLFITVTFLTHMLHLNNKTILMFFSINVLSCIMTFKTMKFRYRYVIFMIFYPIITGFGYVLFIIAHIITKIGIIKDEHITYLTIFY